MQHNNNRDHIQQNLRNAYNFGNGNYFSGYNTQIFCHDGSMDGDYKDMCAKKGYSHIQVVPKYANGDDAMMFCKAISLPLILALDTKS